MGADFVTVRCICCYVSVYRLYERLRSVLPLLYKRKVAVHSNIDWHNRNKYHCVHCRWKGFWYLFIHERIEVYRKRLIYPTEEHVLRFVQYFLYK